MENGLVVSRPPEDREYRLWGWTALYMIFTLVAVNTFGRLTGWFPEADGELAHGYSLFHWIDAELLLSTALPAFLFYRFSGKWEWWVAGSVFLGAVPLEVLNAVTAMGRDVRLDSLIWMGSLGRFYQAAALWAVFTLDITQSPAKPKAVFPLLAFLGTGLLAAAVDWAGFRYPLVSGHFSDQAWAPILSLGALFLFVHSAATALKKMSHYPRGSLFPALLSSLMPLSLIQLLASLGIVAPQGELYGLLGIGAVFLPQAGLARDFLFAWKKRKWLEGIESVQDVAEASSDGILVVDECEKVCFVNGNALEILARKKGDLLGKELGHILPEGRPEGPLEWTKGEFADGPLKFEVALVKNISERRRWEKALAKQERYFRTLMEDLSDWTARLDPEGCFIEVSPQVHKALGFRDSELVGKRIAELINPEDFQKFETVYRRLMERAGARDSLDVRFRNRNNSWRLMECRLKNLMYLPEVEGVLGTFRDITEVRENQRMLADYKEKYDLVGRGSSGGIWDWDMRNDKMVFSPRWKSILGYSDEEVGFTTEGWFGRVHPEDLGLLKSAISAHLCSMTMVLEHEHRILAKNGQYLWVINRGMAVRDKDGKPTRMAGSMIDISDQKNAEEQLKRQAYYDTLTGLPNRSLLVNRLQHAIELSRRRNTMRFAVLFLDLDRFKGINDSLGHMVGDQLLIQTSRRLEKCMRPSDMAARLGGDEFTVLLEEIKDVKEAVNVAERILQELSQPYDLNGQEVFATASLGIALNAPEYSTPEELLRDADTAMYRAKANGKARYEVFDKDMHSRVVLLLQLENDLWRAIEHDELVIHYQPIVSLKTGEITAFEALMRWNHPEKGLLQPTEFIPLAEETGLIVAMGEWLLRKACVQNRQWQKMNHPDLRLAVNFSTRQIQHPDPLKMIQNILWETRMSPKTLELEITESIAMKNSDPGVSTLFKLHFMGVPISIDDFGTGYSSLSSLRRSPASTLKIDQSFLRDIEKDPDNAAITSTIITMAHNLQLNVIAEGVETASQLDFIVGKGCDEVQGFYFSQPLTPEKATELLMLESPFLPKLKLKV